MIYKRPVCSATDDHDDERCRYRRFTQSLIGMIKMPLQSHGTIAAIGNSEFPERWLRSHSSSIVLEEHRWPHRSTDRYEKPS